MLQPRFLLRRRGLISAAAAGTSAFALPSFSSRTALARAARPLAQPRAKSVLLVLLSGGPSQLDTLDPKPSAPAEIRGEFQATSTAVPSVSICEHLPLLAARLDRWAIIRSMAHKEHNHLLATHVALTGRPTPIPRGGSDLDRVESRHDFPNFAAAVNFVRPTNNGIPTGVSLPNYFIEGLLTWPGQHAGFPGARHDPWQINHDPNDPQFKVDALSFPEQISETRLATRRSLLQLLNSTGCSPGSDTRIQAFDDQQAAAFSLLTSARVATAFRMDQEPETTRLRYGRNKFGQSLLLARRLLEAEVPVVQAAMGIVQTWDTHVDNWGRLKTTLLPQLDQALAALIDDLTDSGLLEQTMVFVMGEFGRTPRISTLPGQSVPGRDHWAHAYSILCSGAGIQGGQVLGETDSIAAWPLTRSWTPADVGTTLLSALGIPDDAVVMDPLNRPNPLLNGEIITPLYTGRAV